MKLPDSVDSKNLIVDGINVHYLEAGRAANPTVVLLHGCEFGACAEINWGDNIAAFAEHFHVIAPDWLGYGGTDKIHDFGRGFLVPKLRTLQRLLKTLAIEDADFVGHSCAASFLLGWTSEMGSEWRRVLPVRKMVLVSPSSIGSPGSGRAAHNDYDGSREKMRELVAASFHSDAWAKDDAFVDRQQASAVRPGHWEAVEAIRLRMPGRPGGGPPKPDFSGCRVPLLLVTGQYDKLIAEPDGGMENGKRMLGQTGAFEVFAESGHCSQIEHAARFNTLAIDFLRR